MFPSAHFFSIIIAYLFLSTNYSLPPYSLHVMVLFGVGLDVDIFFKKAHRKTITHSSLILLPPLLFLLILPKYSALVLLSILIHLLLDMVDWEFYPLYPFSKKTIGTNILKNSSGLNPENNSVIDFVKIYFKNKKILFLETTLLIIAITSWIISPAH